MAILDIILIVVLLIFAGVGFWFGLVRTLGYFISLITALLIAVNFYGVLAARLQGYVGGNINLYKFLAFIALFGLTNRLVVLIFWLIEKVVIVPFLGLVNRLLGAFLALLGGILILGLLLYFLSVLPLGNWLSGPLSTSAIASFLIAGSKLLWPLLPAALKQIPVLF